MMIPDTDTSTAAMGGLSIVIPIGPSDTAWCDLVDEISLLEPRPQIVLVFAAGDGQMQAAPRFCTALSAPAGRAHQLNAGIASANRTWLWLLHADSRLQPDTWAALLVHLGLSRRALGWFELTFASDGPWLMPLNALGANLRARWLGLPFGDQGFVVHREDAARLGSFNPLLPFGEDHAWIWRARRIGLPLQRLRGTVMTSARKYAEQGWLRTTLRHLRLTATQARYESKRP